MRLHDGDGEDGDAGIGDFGRADDGSGTGGCAACRGMVVADALLCGSVRGLLLAKAQFGGQAVFACALGDGRDGDWSVYAHAVGEAFAADGGHDHSGDAVPVFMETLAVCDTACGAPIALRDSGRVFDDGGECGGASDEFVLAIDAVAKG